MARVGLLSGAVAALLAGPVAAETIAVACGTGPGAELCRASAEVWAQRTGNAIEMISTPNSATEQLALYQQFLAGGSADIDVLMVDVIWPSILATHLIDLAPMIPAEEIDRHFPALVENNTVNGRFVAMPWFTETAMLYYRKDLLDAAGKQPPTSWAELTATAGEVQAAARAGGNDAMWGFVYQGKAYEGLTCVGLEWIDSFGGGTIVDADGRITVNNPQAVAALEWARATVGTIAPDGVLNYGEEEARGVFQSGNAVFMRNWPYAWWLGQSPDSPVKDKIGVVALPSGGEGGKSSGCLGGWQLAVSAYSRHPDLATDLVRHLTSPDEQKRRAIEASYVPTIGALYDDPDILAALPIFTALQTALAEAVARPSRVTGAKYNQVSSEFFNAVNAVLAGRDDAATALGGLERRLDRLSRGGKW